ncbi:MAG: redox-sensitive bicupin YhaK (pirin superfamily) [Myxococcota bacterium]|jgi:redox-sensitive bicupin YhaK (pirin superfamily)
MNPFSLPRAAQPCDVVSAGEGIAATEGTLPLRRLFPTPQFDGADPFALLDVWGPASLMPEEAPGVEPHPHCHVEVLTLVREGAVHQRASLGVQSSITVGPGDVGWLRAGAGVVHDEVAVATDTLGGRLHAVQLWVSMPKRSWRDDPELQKVRAETVPVVTVDETVRVRVLAGFLGDIAGPIETLADVDIYHVFLDKGARWQAAIAGGRNPLVLAWHGELYVGPKSRPLGTGHIARLGDGTSVALVAGGDGPAEALVLVGRALHQPVARYGPFIADSADGIRAAMARFQRGRMGTLTRR